MANAVRIETKDNEGIDKVVVVKKPTHAQLTDAQFYSASVFNKAKDAGVCLRTKLDEYLREQGLWGDKEQKQVEDLTKKLEKNIRLLRNGKYKDGKKLKLSEARKLAVDIRQDRLSLNFILAKRREHDAYTVEGQAENARFDYLVSACTYDEEGNRVFTDIEDYYEKQEEQYAIDAASKLAAISFNIEEDWTKKLPENEFLIKYKFVDENLRYINKDGKFVNAEGELVDEFGRRITEDGRLLDLSNDPIDEIDGEAEFEDDVYVTEQ